MAKGAVVVIAVFMALQQVGVAEEIVTAAFTLTLGAVALAVGLAFGLGNRDLAGEITRRWYEEGRRRDRRRTDRQGRTRRRETSRRCWTEGAPAVSETWSCDSATTTFRPLTTPTYLSVNRPTVRLPSASLIDPYTAPLAPNPASDAPFGNSTERCQLPWRLNTS